MTTLYCATGNAGKLREFRMAAGQSLPDGRGSDWVGNPDGSGPEWNPPFAIDLLPNFKLLPPAVEDGATFEENAIKKALHYSPHAEGPLFADDSGLEVSALGGAPGVYSARFSGPHATDQSNNQLLLEKLHGIELRNARFVCAIALVERQHVLGVYRGSVEGVILHQPRGAGGFGYDAYFWLPELQATAAELAPAVKSRLSHRAAALRAMREYLGGRAHEAG